MCFLLYYTNTLSVSGGGLTNGFMKHLNKITCTGKTALIITDAEIEETPLFEGTVCDACGKSG